MTIYWTEQADESFAENISYLRNEWNEKVIEDFLENTEAALILIEKNPLLFPAVNNKKVFRKCLRGCLKLLDAFCYNLRAEPPNPLKGL